MKIIQSHYQRKKAQERCQSHTDSVNPVYLKGVCAYCFAITRSINPVPSIIVNCYAAKRAHKLIREFMNVCFLIIIIVAIVLWMQFLLFPCLPYRDGAIMLCAQSVEWR